MTGSATMPGRTGLDQESKWGAFALLGSALLHLLIFCIGAFWLALAPEPPPLAAEPAAEAKPLELLLVPEEKQEEPPPVTSADPPTPPALQAKKEFIDSDGLKQTEQAPRSALFESDVHSRAGSELPATGDAPLPTQQGRELPFIGFEDRNYSLGQGKAVASLPESPGITGESMPAPDLPVAEPAPTPAPTVAPAPKPEPEKVLADRGDLIFSKPEPSPPTVVPTPKPSAREEQKRLAMLTRSPPKKLDPGYRPETRETRVEGAISRRGEAGVDAIGTPQGRYRKVIKDAIGSRWYYYVGQRSDLMTVGVVRVRFWIEPDGAVTNITIVSNTSNETLAAYSVQSIAEAAIPPIPEDVRDKLPDGRLEMTHSFTLY